ncbi:hypothetical protein [Schaalia cardiffensis]|uniref:hypothetical protein n=1 Tax=Schaalia cardiffensis TaxID=181487 RepID=UPI0023F4F2E7|nr:hypothetical protein [Schaalia cardiffensis]
MTLLYTIGSLFSGYGEPTMGVQQALGNEVVPQQAAVAIAMMADQYRRIEWGCAA